MQLRLEKENIKVGLIHLNTVKPLDEEFLSTALKTSKYAITVEEHSIIGGMGSSILEMVNKNKINNVQIERVGIPDKFVEKYGSQETLLKHWKIDSDNLALKMKKFIKINLCILKKLT